MKLAVRQIAFMAKQAWACKAWAKILPHNTLAIVALITGPCAAGLCYFKSNKTSKAVYITQDLAIYTFDPLLRNDVVANLIHVKSINYTDCMGFTEHTYPFCRILKALCLDLLVQFCKSSLTLKVKYSLHYTFKYVSFWLSLVL